jgi:TolA-binding protein
MIDNEKVLSTFETRVRQMILRFQELKKENKDLFEMLEQNEKRIKQLEEDVNRHDRDYQSLKMAKMIEITDGDLQGAKDRLSGLIRDVDRCIAILSDEKS